MITSCIYKNEGISVCLEVLLMLLDIMRPCLCLSPKPQLHAQPVLRQG